MDKKEIFGFLAVIFLMSILFLPQGSESWKSLMFIGLVFGGLWIFGK